MAALDDKSVLEALNRAIRGARHLRVRDAALVAAARQVARRIDEFDAMDNTSAGTFLKYLVQLGLVPPVEVEVSKSKVAPKPADDLAAMRKRLKAQ